MKRRNGFIQLTGMLTAVFLVGLYLALALSSSQSLSRHQALDGLVRELVFDMEMARQHSLGNNVGKDYCKLMLQEDRYVLQHRYRVKKKRPYPPGIRVTKGVVQFDVYGRP
ncbi:hypothetical protein, partial [Megasphaera sp.]